MSAQASHASLVTESLGVISHKDGAKNEYIHLPKLFPLHTKLPPYKAHKADDRESLSRYKFHFSGPSSLFPGGL